MWAKGDQGRLDVVHSPYRAIGRGGLAGQRRVALEQEALAFADARTVRFAVD
jgi:hypothetical protein